MILVICSGYIIGYGLPNMYKYPHGYGYGRNLYPYVGMSILAGTLWVRGTMEYDLVGLGIYPLPSLVLMI